MPSTNAHDRADGDDRVAEQCQWDNRLLRTCLVRDEGHQHHRREHQQRGDAERGPPILRHPGQREQQRHDRADEQREAAPVDLMCRPAWLHVRELEVEGDQRDRADREVDVEARPPRPVVGEPPAQRRPEDRRETEDRREESLILATFLRREDVADDGEEHAGHDAGADALKTAEHDQLSHAVERQERQVARRAAEGRRGDEQDDARHEKRLAAGPVGQAGEDRQRYRRAQQVDRRHPRIAIESGQRGDDARFRRPDDGLVDGREQRREHQSGDRAD